MTKARDLGKLVSQGQLLADGVVQASEVSGLATVATTGSYNDLTNKPTNLGGGTSDYSQLTNKPNLATVATTGSYTDLADKPTLFSGSYTDLTNKPTIPTVPTLATVATSGSYTDLTNKPNLFSGSYADLTNKPTIPTVPTLATVATSGSYTDLADKPTLFSGSYTDLTNKPTLAAVATSGSYADLSNKPVVTTLKVTSISYPGDDLAADPAGGQTITLTGTGFTAGLSVLVNTTMASVVTVVSSTQVTFTAPTMAAGTYVLYLVATDGSVALSLPGISYSGVPNWSTTAGTLGSQYETTVISKNLSATSDSAVTYSLLNGTLPTGSTLNTSTGAISGTAPITNSSTTYNFTIRATDAQNQDTDRAFSITITPDTVTWSNPATNLTVTAEVGTAYSQALAATSAGGNSVTYTSDQLPGGVTLSGSNLSGTFSTNQTLTSTITATAANTNRTATRTVSFTIIVASDTYFKYNTLLLTGNGTNAAQNNTFLDSSGSATTSAIASQVLDPNTAVNGWFTRTGSTVSSYSSSPREFVVRANGVTIYQSTSSFPSSVSYGGVTYTPGPYLDSAYGWAGDYVNRFNIIANSAVFTGNGIARKGNTTQGSFSPYGSNWSNYFVKTASSYVSFPQNSAYSFGTGNFTIEGWLYVSGLGSGNCGFFRIGGAFALTLFNDQGSTNELCLFVDSPRLILESNASMASDTWNHFAVSKSSGTYNFYINGTRVRQVSDSTSWTCSNTVNIGTNINGNEFFAGYLSNLRVSNTALYTGSTLTVPTTPLTSSGSTVLLTCQSNRFIDNSSNAFTATPNGAPSVQRFSPFGPSDVYSASVFGGSGHFQLGNYLTTADTVTANSDATYECWLYQTGSSPDPYAMIFHGASTQVYVDSSGGGSTTIGAVGIYNGNNVASTGKVFERFCWNHIAWVRSGSTTTIYVNGVSVASGNVGGSNLEAYTLGAYNNTVNYNFPGYISDMRFTASAVYNANFTPGTSPLTTTANTKLLCNFTNAGIVDNSMTHDLETVGTTQISTSVKKYGTGSIYIPGSGNSLKAKNTPSINLPGDFTVEFWAYPVSWNQYSPVLETRQADDTSSGLYVMIYSDYWTLYPFTQMADAIANTWQHIAFVRSGNTLYGFKDGTLMQSVSCPTSTYTYSGTGILSLGYAVGDTSFTRNYNGYLDDLRITKGYARYTANFTPPTTTPKLK